MIILDSNQLGQAAPPDGPLLTAPSTTRLSGKSAGLDAPAPSGTTTRTVPEPEFHATWLHQVTDYLVRH
jgi:hypothetical protein